MIVKCCGDGDDDITDDDNCNDDDDEICPFFKVKSDMKCILIYNWSIILLAGH